MGHNGETDQTSVLMAQDAHMMDQLEISLNVQCAICMSTFQNPKLLPCSHTFCMSCLEHTFNHQGDTYCPVCRLEVHLPRGGVCKLPDNPQVFRDAFETLKKIHISKVKAVNSLSGVFKYKIEQFSSQISAILEQQASIKRLLDNCCVKMTTSLVEEYNTCNADLEKCIADLLDQMDTVTSLEDDTVFKKLTLTEAEDNINKMFPVCTCNVGTVFYHKLCHLSTSLSDSSINTDNRDAKRAEAMESREPLTPSAPSEDDVFSDAAKSTEETDVNAESTEETGACANFVRATNVRQTKKKRTRLSIRNFFRSRNFGKSKMSDSESESDVENSHKFSTSRLFKHHSTYK